MNIIFMGFITTGIIYIASMIGYKKAYVAREREINGK